MEKKKRWSNKIILVCHHSSTLYGQLKGSLSLNVTSNLELIFKKHIVKTCKYTGE